MKTILKGINTITTVLCIVWLLWRPLGIMRMIESADQVQFIFDGIAMWSLETLSVSYISYTTLAVVFGFTLVKIVGVCILHKLVARGLN